MKKDRIIKLCMTICLILGISVMPINQLEVKANEIIATVQGTISSGTTSDLLRLSTPQGNMEIKLDSDTDASACKILLPGKKISVSVSVVRTAIFMLLRLPAKRRLRQPHLTHPLPLR